MRLGAAVLTAAAIALGAATCAARCVPEPPLAPGPPPLPMAVLFLVGEAPALTGSAAIGSPTRGSLWGGVQMVDGEDIERAGAYAWATASVVRSIERAARETRRCHPDSPRVMVGDLAREHGGWLKPHRSHQSGLDADIGYFHRGPYVWYQRATARSFDAARTWTLLRALIEGGNVETIFVDASVQQMLKAHIATLPKDEQAPSDVFATPQKRDAIIRHAWGHATHFHVRFRDPDAEALGARLEAARPKPKPPVRVARR